MQIIEKIEGDGRTACKTVGPTQATFRKQRELYWMLTLRTVFPYGLNDRIGDEFKTEESHFAIASRFTTLKRSCPRIARGKARKGQNRLTCNTFLQALKNHFSTSLHDALNYIRVSISSMNKSMLKQLADIVNDELLDQPADFKFTQWYSAILDLIDTKLYKPKPKKSPPTNLCRIFFDNKGIERINLSRIFHDPEVKASIPSIASKFETPTVIFKLSQTTGSKIFNFNKFVRNLDIDSVVNDISILPCLCRLL